MSESGPEPITENPQPDYMVRKGGVFRAIGRYFKETFTGEYPSAASASDDPWPDLRDPIDKRIEPWVQREWDELDENDQNKYLAVAQKETMKIAETYSNSDYTIEYDEPHERIVHAMLHFACIRTAEEALNPFGF